MAKTLTPALLLADPDSTDEPLLAPADVDEILENPEAMLKFARILSVANLDNLYRVMQHPSVKPEARIEFQKLLNRMGGLEKQDTTQGTGPQVIINITRAKDAGKEPVTIEGTTVEIPASLEE